MINEKDPHMDLKCCINLYFMEKERLKKGFKQAQFLGKYLEKYETCRDDFIGIKNTLKWVTVCLGLLIWEFLERDRRCG